MASSSWSGYAASTKQSSPTERSKKSQPRQLLSCTKCRERKVKCDRTKPCSACCARGHPKECEFVVGEGNDYSPIQQSYEIRKLRQENLELKRKLQNLHQGHHSAGESDDDESPDRKSARTVSRHPSSRQRRFKTGDKVDNLYFGTPGLASIVSDFANLQVGSHSLTHTMPKGRDLYASDDQPSYPFPVVESRSTIAALVAILPEPETLFSCLDMFQRRAQSCSFPHMPDEVTRKEVQRFLDNKERNAALCPDMLALIFATVATGLQMGQYDRSGERWVQEDIEKTRRTSDAFISASMQALRLASFMNRPTLLAIQTLVMMGPYLTNSGRFLDAWILFGTTVRLAHSIGLHRDPKLLDPAPPLRESTVRQTLWWWILHMDQQYSVTLGRPLGISGYGDCPPPEPLTTNPTVLRLAEFVDHFTILARQILSSDGMMSVSKIDDFTDRLIGLWDTMPLALQFNESWLQQQTVLPEWPLEMMSATLFAQVQSYLILLNRQRVERTQSYARHASHSPPTYTHERGQPPYPGSEQPIHPAPVRGRHLVIVSSISILKTFMFFRHRNPGVLMCWTIGQQAFNACMILLLDAWECQSGEQNEWLINQAYVVFVELQNHGVHRLAELAVQRISDGLAKLGHRQQEREAKAAMSRRASQHSQPQLQIDTANMTDWAGDTVMGNTGMFLLEDPGLQSYNLQANLFRPLGWQMAGSLNAELQPSAPQSHLHVPSPIVPVSQVSAAPFPIMASPPFVPGAGALPVTNSPYAVGLQPRLTSGQRRPSASRHGYAAYHGLSTGAAYPQQMPHAALEHGHHAGMQFPAQMSQQGYGQGARAHGSSGSQQARGSGSREAHRAERTARSQQRRR